MKGFGQTNKKIDERRKVNSYKKRDILIRAISLHSQGKIEKAAELYRILIQNKVEDSRIYLNYGVICKQQGNFQKAEELYKAAIKQNPEKPEAYSNLSIILKDQKKYKEAKLYLQKAILLRPNYIDAILNFSQLLYEQGDLVNAEIHLRNAIDIQPTNFLANLNLGALLKDIGNLNDAENFTNNAINIEPNNEVAYINLALIKQQRFDFPSGIENSNKAITLNPNSEFAHNILGSILADNGDLHNAIIETKKAIAINKNYAEAYVNISKLYDQEGNTEESILSAKQAIKLKPHLTSSYFLLSTINPIQNLSDYKDYLFSEEIVKNQKNIDMIDIFFARANYLEKKYLHNEEVKMLNSANRLNRKIYGSNYDNFTNQINYYYNESKQFEEINTTGRCSVTPIFAVGLPRSGKTILESILCRNDLVEKCGENRALSISINEYREKLKSSKKSLGEIYIKNMQKNLIGKKYLCTTNPSNFIYTGMIAAGISNAKIIYCYRNPLDNIKELYKMNLKNKYSFKSSIEESAKLYILITQTMKKYKKRFEDSIYFLNYDDLVSNTKTELKELLHWLDWDYNEKYLFPDLDTTTQKNKDKKNSLLNTNHINTWKNYKELVEPARKILEISMKEII